jgi:hypothetical protein
MKKLCLEEYDAEINQKSLKNLKEDMFSTLELTYRIKSENNKNIINNLFCHSSKEFWVKICENTKKCSERKVQKRLWKELIEKSFKKMISTLFKNMD